ncbi:hypothetical protein A7D16_18720 [Xanthomonas nasturtii]|nr:hypothetical protein A7D16_18720 [Xanthomonas nasturtii]
MSAVMVGRVDQALSGRAAMRQAAAQHASLLLASVRAGGGPACWQQALAAAWSGMCRVASTLMVRSRAVAC